MVTPAKIAVGVLAAIGLLAVIGVGAMALMHGSMMGGWGC